MNTETLQALVSVGAKILTHKEVEALPGFDTTTFRYVRCVVDNEEWVTVVKEWRAKDGHVMSDLRQGYKMSDLGLLGESLVALKPHDGPVAMVKADDYFTRLYVHGVVVILEKADPVQTAITREIARQVNEAHHIGE